MAKRIATTALLGFWLLAALVACDGCSNDPPTALFTYEPRQGNSPLYVTFNAFGSSDADGTITKWDWNFGDGSLGLGENVYHTFTATATTNFEVSLTVQDNDGDVGTTKRYVTVFP